MSIVDVGGDRGQPVPALSVHRPTRHQLGTPQGLVYIQATEVIIDGNRLRGEREGWTDGSWGEDEEGIKNMKAESCYLRRCGEENRKKCERREGLKREESERKEEWG